MASRRPGSHEAEKLVSYPSSSNEPSSTIPITNIARRLPRRHRLPANPYKSEQQRTTGTPGSPSTISSRLSGTSRSDALRPEHVDGLYEQLLSSGGRDGGPLAPKTVHEVHLIVRNALDLAVQRCLVWIMIAAEAPEQLDDIIAVKHAELDEPDMIKLYSLLSGAVDWPPDHPRVVEVADIMERLMIRCPSRPVRRVTTTSTTSSSPSSTQPPWNPRRRAGDCLTSSSSEAGGAKPASNESLPTDSTPIPTR